MMKILTAGNSARPFRIDYRGPHRQMTSDGLPILDLPQNQPVVAGTQGVVGVEPAPAKETRPVKPDRPVADSQQA